MELIEIKSIFLNPYSPAGKEILKQTIFKSHNREGLTLLRVLQFRWFYFILKYYIAFFR
jgi:hypothetical protein